MSTDPASVVVEFSISGLNAQEALALFAVLPIGAHAVNVTQHPGEKPLRYEFEIRGSVRQAEDALRGLREHQEWVATIREGTESPPKSSAALATKGDDPRYVRLGPHETSQGKPYRPSWNRLPPQGMMHLYDGSLHPHGSQHCCVDPVTLRHDMYPDAPPLE